VLVRHRSAHLWKQPDNSDLLLRCGRLERELVAPGVNRRLVDQSTIVSWKEQPKR